MIWLLEFNTLVSPVGIGMHEMSMYLIVVKLLNMDIVLIFMIILSIITNTRDITLLLIVYFIKIDN